MDEVTFGRYQLIEVIGRGGMGAVFKAHDTVMRRDVAVKILRPELADQPGYRERFRRETHTAAQLNEPHIIAIYDTGEIEGRLYLVMPIIAGIDLASLLGRDGPMPPPLAVQVIEQLAAALTAAHNAGLVHRDVKPSNALMTANEFVYLIDLGIAHDASATQLTRTRTTVGTWAYMAPERFNTGLADARSDVYALACVLFECLTDHLPYPGNSLGQQIEAHLTRQPPQPSTVDPALPVDFDEVIARGLAKDPDARYHSAQQLATAARHALAQDPPTFRPTLPAQPPTLIDSPGPAVPTGTPGQTLAATQVPPAYTVSPATDEPRRSRKPWIIAAAAAATVITTAIAVVIIHPWARPTRTVAPDRLDSILLTAQEADTIMGAANLQPPKSIRHATYTDPPLTTSNPQCLSKSVPARDEVYQSTGYTAVSADMLSAPKGEPERYVNQAAVSFASADKSLAFVKSSAGAWRACARQSYTVTVDGQTDRWTPGNVVGVTPEISQLRTLDGGGDFACQHVLSAVLNLVVDVRACGYKVNEQARQVADKMAAKATS